MPDDGIIGVTIGEADLAPVRAELDGIVADVNKAVIVPALNRTAEQGATAVRRAIAPIIGLPQTRLKKLVKPIKANYQTYRAAVRILAYNVPLGKTNTKTAPASGSYPLGKFGPPRPLPFKGFKATMKSGRQGFWVRQTRKRLPISEIYQPSPRWVFETAPGLASTALANIEALLRKNLQSQIDRRLGGK